MHSVLFSLLFAIGNLLPLTAQTHAAQPALEHELRDDLRGAVEFNEVKRRLIADPQLARGIVRDELRRWPTGTIASRCLAILAEIGESEDAMLVLPYLRAAGDGFVRWRALTVVVTHGDNRVLGAVEMCLYDENSSVREVAIDFFEKRESKWSNEALRRFLEFQPKSDEMKKDQDRVSAILHKTGPAKK
jgi:hypothetical protein